MNLDVDKILKNLLKNERIIKRVNELELTKEQILESIPILIDMNEEKVTEDRETFTSFDLVDGLVKRTVVLSQYGKKRAYLNNIVTQKINPIDFEEEKEFLKEENRKVLVAQFSKILKLPKQKQKGLFIYGKMGIGKTFIMKRFAKILAEQNNKIGFINVANLISTIKFSFNKEKGYEGIIKLLKEVEYLFVDDIGSEIVSSWFRDEILFSILNERMDKSRTTFFSSNFSIKNLELQEAKTNGQKYLDREKSARLITRIRALSSEVEVKGSNKRY